MRKRTDGFTLVELMVVVLIIGILVAVAVPVFNAAKANAQKNTCKANQRTIIGAIEAKNASDTPMNVYGWLGDFTQIWVGAGTRVDWGRADMPALGMQLVPTYLKTVPVCPARNYPTGQELYPQTGYFFLVASSKSTTIVGFGGDQQWGWSSSDHKLF